MSKVFYDKPIIEQIFEEFYKDMDSQDEDKLINLVNRLPPEDVNKKNKYGNTVLICATIYNYTEIVKLLSKKEEIDVNIQNMSGDTALIQASVRSRIEIVKLLLEKDDIDINIQDYSRYTALRYACPEIANLLKNHQKIDL